MDLRAAIRAELREGARTGRFREEDSAAIARFFAVLSSGAARLAGMYVALYRATPEELSLGPLEKFLRERGARLCFPRVADAAARSLELAEVPNEADEHWARGPYGIDEPHASLAAVAPDLVELVIVPGVAFGPGGERLGRGSGYYDRFLPRANRALRVAITREFQVLPALEQQPWDQKVHWVLSRKHDIRTPQVARWLLGPTA